MDFKTLRRKIELYLNLQGTEQKVMIEDFINDGVLDFIRMAEWSKCWVAETITLDGSNSYDLSTVLNNFFWAEIELLDENGRTYIKVDYNTYLKTVDRIGYYSIMGDTLYVVGDTGNMNFIFLSPGLIKPLSKDADENRITRYYPDIVQVLVNIDVFEFIGDDEAKAAQEKRLARKIISLKKSENRTRNRGKLHQISRTGPEV